jgi:hypothetical protein
MVLAEGRRCNVSASTFSARRRRVAHSVTTRSEPRKPCVCNERQSAAPLCRPFAHCRSNHGRPRFERCFARSEYVASFATQNAPNHTPAVAGTPHDVLYGEALVAEAKNRSVDVRAVQISFILQAFSGGQQFGIFGHRTNCAADLPHRPADCIEESAGCILHQMPTVGDLNRVREGFGCRSRVGPFTIKGDDGDL